MHRLEFAEVYDYSGEDESVVIPVVLRSGANEVPVAASLDTGASFCIFGTEIAEALGLDLTSWAEPSGCIGFGLALIHHDGTIHLAA